MRVYDRHLSIQNLTGANKSFALESIPHLATMLSHDLPAVVENSQIIVVSHRLSPAEWNTVKWSGNQRIIDVADVPALQDLPNYEGLYW